MQIEFHVPTDGFRSVSAVLRHLVNFVIFFLGVLCFYVFCQRRFGQGIGLLAAICLATHPLLFSHAFYNVKDISFLTMFVAAMLTLDTWFSRPSWPNALRTRSALDGHSGGHARAGRVRHAAHGGRRPRSATDSTHASAASLPTALA